VACDIYRPAAIQQLRCWRFYGVEFIQNQNKNPVEIAQNAIKYAKKGFDTVIVDTAGRLAVDTEMMDEISRVHKAIQPHETCLLLMQ
jgi:signal recognition particle subunit SRP54